MESLYAFARELEPGDEIRWVGQKAEYINFHNVGLNVIDDVHRDEAKITVEATGPKGAEVGFWVEKEDDNQVLYQNTPQGEMKQAQVPQKDLHYVDK